MTTVYFVRHAQPNYNNHDDMLRELTEKGLADRLLVTEYLSDKAVDAVLSSPYIRSVDTVKHFADSAGLEVKIVDDFRERKIDSVWIDDFDSFSKRQWSDFSYKLSDGESLGEVQRRNISALERVLDEYCGKTVVIGSHGTALSTIINYFDNSFGYEQFCEIKGLMPWVVCMKFDEQQLIEYNSINIFDLSLPIAVQPFCDQ